MYSEEELLEEIRRLADDGSPPTQTEIKDDGKSSPGAYYRRFGSWNEAVKAAGFSPNQRVDIPRQELLAEIERLANGDDPPTQGEMAKDGQFTPSVYESRFNSWNEAVSIAGFSPNKRQDVPEQELLKEIRRLADGDNPPTQTDIRDDGKFSSRTYRRRFGSWNEAVKAAGFSPNQRVDIPRQELLAEIERLADGDDPPIQEEMTDNGQFSLSAYKGRFGTWNGALREAGFRTNVRRNIPERELLGEIQYLTNDGRLPTQAEMIEDGRFSLSVYIDRFGTWNEALREANSRYDDLVSEFNLNDRVDIPERELLKELRHHAISGLAPPFQYICDNEDFEFSGGVYAGRSTIWRESVRAGLRPWVRRPLTDEGFNAFFDAAVDRLKPTQRLVALLFQFTGLTPRLMCELTSDWVTRQPTGLVITVPNKFTKSGEEWVFKLPNRFGDGRETNLAGWLDWYFDQYGSIQYSSPTACINTVYRVAQDASLDRRIIETQVGPAPEVRPLDLRATGGVRMVRNNASERSIRRHLGLAHTNSKARVEDFFLFAHVHHNHEHPEYEPPDLVLDPVEE